MNRVDDPADPQRCQGKAPDGQCMNRAEPGFDCCMVHNGGHSIAKAEDLRLYHLTEARSRQRLAELSGHNPLQALRDIIALAHLLLEKRFNLIQGDDDFLLAYRDLNTLQLTMERLKKTAHTIEQNLGVLLGKSNALRFGQHTIKIVADELAGIENYAGTVQRISTQIIQAIATANNHSDPSPLKVPVLIGKDPEGVKTFLIENLEDQIRLAELGKHERIKSLNEDIALQVVIIERRWNLIRTPTDLISAAGQLCTGMKTLEKQIKSAHEIEQTLGNLLTVETVQRLGQLISQIITDELEFADVPEYELLSDRIMDRIATTPLEQTPRRLK